MNGLKSAYIELMHKNKLNPDADQLAVIMDLDNYLSVLNKPWWLYKLSNKFNLKQGVYLWGEVGRGKTMILDLFFANLKTNCKLKIHLHEFMLKVQSKLQDLSKSTNPIDKVSKNLSSHYKIIYIDEFIIEDVADAMLLADLIPSLLKHKVFLFFSSNYNPQELYKNGLQRHKFIKSIKVLTSKLDVININVDKDFRKLNKNPITYENLIDIFHKLSGKQAITYDSYISLNFGKLLVLARTSKIALVTFNALCENYLSALDYLKFIAQFKVILIQDIPVLDDNNINAVKRFIIFIDICYQHGNRVIFDKNMTSKNLYIGRKLAFEFKRTASRVWQLNK